MAISEMHKLAVSILSVLICMSSSAGEADDYPERVFWGDTHLHTANSSDAFAFGARLGTEQALRFAMGEEVTSTSGLEARLARPLDFLVIADHAEGLGIMRETYMGNPALISDPVMARWAGMMRAGGDGPARAALEMIVAHSSKTLPAVVTDPKLATPIARSIWDAHTETVERYNKPGTFTAFMGYEYTSAPGGNNLHRVVVFRDGKDRVKTILPFSSFRSEDPEDLWVSLQQYENDTGGKVLAIPHNSNLSNGRMFAFVDFEGNTIDADYARTRARWEPLVEATQIKGDSESHPFLSPNDEFAGFGDAGWEDSNLTGQEAKVDSMLAGDYAREALKRGLDIARTTGYNPYKAGLIGSTDAHTGLSTGDEDNFFGKHTSTEPSAERLASRAKNDDGQRVMGWDFLAGGYAAIWSRTNTREDLFDAMMRKEVYASTGPRITLRFFGGWDFVPEDAAGADLVAAGYARGVPMGGDLPSRVGKQQPRFLVAALMDPEGANLDRIQIVKGWISPGGQLHERVYDVAWSDADDRQLGGDGKLQAVGNTVDLSVPTWSNDIGAPELATAWGDPDFDASVSAFYYARVIEIPTPRWTAYDAIRFELALPDEALLTTQERAYSSPIWYTAAKQNE